MPVAMWVMRTAEVGGVDVLAACARRAVGVDADIRFRNVDLDRIVDDRIDPDAGEGGVAPRIAVVGRDAHQAMHARFRLQPAIGVVALDQHGGRLDARLFAVVDFQNLDLEAATLGPARVHAQEHRGPVLALGAAGAGVDFEIGVVVVGFAREQGLDLPRPDLAGQRADGGFGLATMSASPSSSPSLDQAEIVVKRLAQALDGADAVVERLALAHQFLRLLRVVPEVARPLPACSGNQAVLPPDPSQRCLLSRLMACLISSTMFCVSARMGACFFLLVGPQTAC